MAQEVTGRRRAIAEILAGHAGSKAFLSEDSCFDHIRHVWYGYADALMKHLPAETPEAPSAETTHYISGGPVTQCCGRSPIELPGDERITVDPAKLTCTGRGIRPLVWPINRLNPQTGEPWPRCPVHPECPVIGNSCISCEE